MTKNILLATSMVALGMFSSVEGMNGLPNLITSMSTNSVKQFTAVKGTISEISTEQKDKLDENAAYGKNTIGKLDSVEVVDEETIGSLIEKNLDQTFDKLQTCHDECGKNSEEIVAILVKEFENLEKLLEGAYDTQQRSVIIQEYKGFILDIRRVGFFDGDYCIVNAFAKAGLDPFKGLGIELALTTPDNYCLFIASRYFNTIDDHINFVQVSHRLELNMEKFHYNPISVDEKTAKFFPNVETLHVYEYENKYLTGGRIFKYVDWRPHFFSEVLEIRKENPEKNIGFKDVTFDEDGFKHLLKTKGKELVGAGLITLVDVNAGYIKENIKSIDLDIGMLHIYNGNDQYLEGCRIFQDVDWRYHSFSFSEVLKIREENPKKILNSRTLFLVNMISNIF